VHAALNDEVVPFLVPVFTEPLEQRVIKSFMSMGDKSHPPNFARLLRACRKRPRSRTAEQRDELAAPHMFSPQSEDYILPHGCRNADVVHHSAFRPMIARITEQHLWPLHLNKQR
jgi:hypothetical protein